MACRRSRAAAAAAALAALLLACAPAAGAEEVDCYGAHVEVAVAPAPAPGGGPAPPATRVYGYGADFGAAPDTVAPVPLALASPRDACAPVAPAPEAGAAALVARGNCTFAAKAAHLQAAGFGAMLLANGAADGDACVAMHANASEAGASLRLAAVAVTAEAGRRLAAAAAAGAPRVSLREVPPPAVDTAALVLWALATGSVVAGGLWAGADAARGARGRYGDRAGGGGAHAPEAITARGAAAFLVVSSAVLLGLFFLLSRWLVLALVAAYTVLAWSAAAAVLGDAARGAAGAAGRASWARASVRLPLLGATPAADVAAGAAAAAAAATWAACRHAHWAWALQDFLSVCVILVVLRSVALPSLRVAAVLLPAAFVYDVWWVFLQPAVTGGPSVMVAVATAAGAAERLPMLLLAPQAGPGSNPAYSMLGLGDVVLPGLLVALARRFDLARRLPPAHGYFAPACAGYGAGLVATYAALRLALFGDQGQPALLYLVPATLGTVAALAAARGDFWDLWTFGDGEGALGGESSDDEGAAEAGAAARLLPGGGDADGASSGSSGGGRTPRRRAD